jgi:carbamoyl-phosphate synthase large subunit
MPKRTDIKKILIIGAGPIVIGQGCEFDYSGTQACLALLEEGYEIILLNSNAATIMNDRELIKNSHSKMKTYIEPLTIEFLEKIIEKEKPDAILPTVGGQTALNLTVQAYESGLLEKHNIEMIGAKLESIKKAEDRLLFANAMKKIGLSLPYSVVVESLEQANQEIKKIGYPAIIRPSFTLGGTGGGIAYNKDEFEKMIVDGLNASPVHSIQIDKSVLGWKEYEMEIMHDKNGNFLNICSIENLDPMGVHTGDSITIAPSMTLTDKEFQQMRNSAKMIAEEIGLETGGANVQFAVNPENGEQLVVEMNPRVSRSSALASKATGYPIAKIAALAAVGYSLDEITNDCTDGIPASFEPTLDYIVVKIPRFNFDKFPSQNNELNTAMKAIGEVMAIGRSFPEALQKAICSLEEGIDGLFSKENKFLNDSELMLKQKSLLNAITRNIPDRLLKSADAMRTGINYEEICQITKYDKWFVSQIQKYIIESERKIKNHGIQSKKEMFFYKQQGFSDSRLGFLIGKTRDEIYQLRKKWDINPVFKRVDTCGAEFNVKTSYLYSTYDGDTEREIYYCECNPTTKKKVVIIGSGCNRIGQGIEFDYSCVHAANAVREMGFECIMINCNPETVSTDYRVSDKLYFEPLDTEHVLNIIDKEKQNGELLGVIVQFGGQTSLKLVNDLRFYNIPILGTNADSLDIAEDRERFRNLLNNLNLTQPKSLIASDLNELCQSIKEIGMPLLVRPSNVLGGRSMSILYEENQLEIYLKENPYIFETGAVLIDEFLDHATEIDVDALCDKNQNVYICGIMEHIEEAGVHSGDSTCITPAPYLKRELINKIKEIAVKLAQSLQVIGLINIQMAIKDDKIYIIEANPRASRTIPFISKHKGISFADIATKIMLGKKISDFDLKDENYENPTHYSVKMPVFPFLKFKNADCNLGPEMKSTGESMGIDKNFEAAFAKAFIGANHTLPISGKVLISVRDSDKNQTLIDIARKLIQNDFELYGTKGTSQFLKLNGIKCIEMPKVTEARPNIMDMIINNEVTLYINTSDSFQAVREGLEIRRTTMMRKIPCIRTISHAYSLVKAINFYKNNKIDIKTLQEY